MNCHLIHCHSSESRQTQEDLSTVEWLDFALLFTWWGHSKQNDPNLHWFYSSWTNQPDIFECLETCSGTKHSTRSIAHRQASSHSNHLSSFLFGPNLQVSNIYCYNACMFEPSHPTPSPSPKSSKSRKTLEIPRKFLGNPRKIREKP